MRSPANAEASPIATTPGVLDGGHSGRDTQAGSASVDLDRGHDASDAQAGSAPVSLPSANRLPVPMPPAPGADLGTDQSSGEAQVARVGADLAFDRPLSDAQVPTVERNLNGDQGCLEAPPESVAESEGAGQGDHVAQTSTADPSDALLLILADRLNDIEGLRKATANQLSALTRSSDIAGGKGLSEHSKAAVSMADWLALLEQEEHRVVLQLQRALRQHPLGSWVKSTVGIGEKQGARLIAAIGDPAWNSADDRPRRGPAELWAYCGYAPDQKRRKGVQSNWNAEAKMRAFLCAESCVKQRHSPFRPVYDAARVNWAERDTSDGHKHAHALRCVAKAILKDLWLAARAANQANSNEHAPVSAARANPNGKKAAA